MKKIDMFFSANDKDNKDNTSEIIGKTIAALIEKGNTVIKITSEKNYVAGGYELKATIEYEQNEPTK